jgi:hypothetical protein
MTPANALAALTQQTQQILAGSLPSAQERRSLRLSIGRAVDATEEGSADEERLLAARDAWEDAWTNRHSPEEVANLRADRVSALLDASTPSGALDAHRTEVDRAIHLPASNEWESVGGIYRGHLREAGFDMLTLADGTVLWVEGELS